MHPAQPHDSLVETLRQLALELGGLGPDRPGVALSAHLAATATRLEAELAALPTDSEAPVAEVLGILPQLVRHFTGLRVTEEGPRLNLQALLTILRPEERSDDIELSLMIRNAEDAGTAHDVSVQIYAAKDSKLRAEFDAGERHAQEQIGDIEPGRARAPVFYLSVPPNAQEEATELRLRAELHDGKGVVLSQGSFTLQVRPGRRDRAVSPYCPGQRVTGEHFIGRDRELKTIFDSLLGDHQDRTCVVVGIRRIGKTSILFRVKEDPEVRQHYYPIYVDVEDRIDTTVSFFVYLCERIRDGLPQKVRDQLPFHRDAFRDDPYMAFERFADALSAIDTRQRVLLILDELETLVDLAQKGASTREQAADEIDPSRVFQPQVFGALRKAIMKGGGLKMLFAGLPKILEATYHDRLFGLLLPVRVGPFSEKAASEILDASRQWFTFSQAARDLVLRKTGLQPYLLQLVCHSIFGRMVTSARDQVTPHDVDTVIKESILPNEAYFTDYVSLIGGDAHILRAMAILHQEVGERRSFVSVTEIANELNRLGYQISVPTLRDTLNGLASGDRPLIRSAPNASDRFQLLIGILGDRLIRGSQSL